MLIINILCGLDEVSCDVSVELNEMFAAATDKLSLYLCYLTRISSLLFTSCLSFALSVCSYVIIIVIIINVACT